MTSLGRVYKNVLACHNYSLGRIFSSRETTAFIRPFLFPSNCMFLASKYMDNLVFRKTSVSSYKLPAALSGAGSLLPVFLLSHKSIALFLETRFGIVSFFSCQSVSDGFACKLGRSGKAGELVFTWLPPPPFGAHTSLLDFGNLTRGSEGIKSRPQICI